MSTHSAAGRRRGQRAWQRALVGSLLGAVVPLLSSACDYPTSAPKWRTEWLVPVKGTTLTVGELLPPGVTIADDSSAFLASVAPVTITRSLGELCGAPCQDVSGRTVPKPAFSTTVEDTVWLPSDLAAATVASGSVAISIHNGLGFDPLRPGGTARGTIVITLASAGATVGTLTLDGDSVALAPGSTLLREIPLTGSTLGPAIVATALLTSPAGAAVPIDASQSFSLTASPQSLRLADVSVSVSEKPVAVSPFALDLGNVDASIVDHVATGSLVLDVANPFPVAGDLQLTVTGAGLDPITKPLPLAPGDTTETVAYTQDEMRSMLGQASLEVGAEGVVTAREPVRLTPTMTVRIDARLDLIVGSEGN